MSHLSHLSDIFVIQLQIGRWSYNTCMDDNQTYNIKEKKHTEA